MMGGFDRHTAFRSSWSPVGAVWRGGSRRPCPPPGRGGGGGAPHDDSPRGGGASAAPARIKGAVPPRYTAPPDSLGWQDSGEAPHPIVRFGRKKWSDGAGRGSSMGGGVASPPW